jgi:ADP-L-glycero-D-manno-heptose 6-epimerase
MIIITGGAGFIGSALVWKLNQNGITDILIVDELSTDEKWKNLVNLKFSDYVEKHQFLDNLFNGFYDATKIEKIFHMGACSSTQEQNASYLIENNFEYTKFLAEYCIENNIQFVYASSAATYGDGNNGYSDKNIEGLQPLNAYGYSKQLFDQYATNKKYFEDKTKNIIGIKFFNVYGPNENHKADMRSMINKAYHQIQKDGKIGLFKSYNPQYADGEQKRDFLYIKDAIEIVLALSQKSINGIYNIGTGKAHSWNELAKAIFKATNIPEKIQYIEMPEILHGKYQYFTEADMSKTLSTIGGHKFYSLEDAVLDYVKNYLAKDAYLGMEK